MTNWNTAFTHTTNLTAFLQVQGEERLNTAIIELLKGEGTFAVSQNTLHTSEHSTRILVKLLTDWQKQDESAKLSQ